MNLYIKLIPASVKCVLIEQLLTPGSQSYEQYKQLTYTLHEKTGINQALWEP